MKEYIRTELTITEFDAEDVITTSGVPSDPQNRVRHCKRRLEVNYGRV